MICPDCGGEVREVLTRSGPAFADPVDGGPWVIAKRILDADGETPLALRANARSKEWAADDGQTYQRHRCSRRVEIRDSLSTLRRVYGERKGSPSLSVPMSRVEGTVEPGDVLTLHNGRGGVEVRAEVKRVEFVAVPRWETFKRHGEHNQPREALSG